MATRIPWRSHCLRHLKLLCCIRQTQGEFCSRRISRLQAHAVSRLGGDLNKFGVVVAGRACPQLPITLAPPLHPSAQCASVFLHPLPPHPPSAPPFPAS